MTHLTETGRIPLEIRLPAQYHQGMIRCSRLSRLLIALAMFCVMYAGPVAACVCVMDSMSDMPCCPDQQGPDQSNCIQPDAQVGSVCDPVPADTLTSASFDFSVPAAIFAAPLPLWSARDPPRVPIPSTHRLPDTRPIYLTTLRLRN
jgi:hypothetical protein